MQLFLSLVAFGLAFLATRFVTTWLFMQISPRPAGAGPYEWWGWYASVLISLLVAMFVMALVDRASGRR